MNMVHFAHYFLHWFSHEASLELLKISPVNRCYYFINALDMIVFLTECNRAVIEAGYVLDDHLSASTEEIDATAYRGRKNLVLGN